MNQLSATCQCGKVRFEAFGRPLLVCACYCSSCQEAGRRFEQLASAPPVLDPDGGTEMVLYRKDRVQCVAGQEHLEAHRLKPHSPTRRVIANCCNSPMFVDFTKGHWLSLYRERFAGDAPPLQIRIMTKERRTETMPRDGLPNTSGFPGKFVPKLLLAWAAMGFRKPQVFVGKER